MASTQATDNSTAPQLTTEQMGQMLQAAAYAEPPIDPEGLALVIIIVVLIITVLSTIVLGLRVYVRGWMGRQANLWGWEDSFAVGGWILFVISSVFCVKAAYYGLGTRDVDLNNFLMVRCAEYLLYSEILYGFSMPMIKASIVFTLLRITTNKIFRWILYAMQFIATTMALIGILASLLYCRPVNAYWNPLLGTCGDFMVVVNIGYAWTSVGIVTDWTCAILPFFIVRKLQMAPRTKMTVMMILGLAAVASTATVVRAPFLKFYLDPNDRLYWNGYISLFGQLESGLGLIAACLPALRMLFRKYLDGTRNATAARSKPYAYGSNGSRNGEGRDKGVPMDTLSPTGRVSVVGGKWSRLEDENSSAQNIVQVHQEVTVETESFSDDDKHYHRKV